MFRVVTIARECGSGGAEIARRIAENLDWRLLDDSLIAVVARRAQVDIDTARQYDESVDSRWHRMNRSSSWCAAIMGGLAPLDFQFFDADTMAVVTHQVIADAAAKGNCVIVGRGAQCVLQSCPHALHAFVYGPWSERVDRIRQRLGTQGDAARWIQSMDRARAAYLQRQFGRDWKDPHLYQMALSSQLGIDHVASLITSAVVGDALAATARASAGASVPEAVCAIGPREVIHAGTD